MTATVEMYKKHTGTAGCGRDAGKVAWPLLSVGLFLTLSGIAPGAPAGLAAAAPILGTFELVAVGAPAPAGSPPGADPGGAHAVPYAESARASCVCIGHLWQFAEESQLGDRGVTEEWNNDGSDGTAPREYDSTQDHQHGGPAGERLRCQDST